MNTATYRELLRGKGAHVDPVASLEHVSAAVAGRRVDGYPHSVWQIVRHMNYWMDYELRRIAGQRPSHPAHASESWPAEPAPASEAEWNGAQKELAEGLERFAALSASTSEILRSRVEAMHAGETSRTSTVEAVLWQILAHNSYHVGQIAVLLQCFGLWPPPAGGDSW